MDEKKTIEWKNERRRQETRSGKNVTELRNIGPIIAEKSFRAIRRIFQARDSENVCEIIN